MKSEKSDLLKRQAALIEKQDELLETQKELIELTDKQDPRMLSQDSLIKKQQYALWTFFWLIVFLFGVIGFSDFL